MLRFNRSDRRWWNKPLVAHAGRDLPAELVILELSMGPGEEGAWMNSRGRSSGVVALRWDGEGKAETIRRTLPDFVSMALEKVYQEAHLARGCPDLVIWNPGAHNVRLVEVKCPHWDRPSDDQHEFIRVAAHRGIPAEVVEWEFASH